MEGILLGIVVGLQLKFDWFGDKRRMITKTLFLPMLLLFYVLRTETLIPTLLGALFFGWIGDLFMMVPRGRRLRMIGPVAFAIGHLFYLASFVQFGSLRNIPISGLIVLVLYPLWIWIGYRLMGRQLKEKGAPFYLALVYAAMIGAMSLYSYSMVYTQQTILPFIGAVIFIISDTMVLYRDYGRAFERNKFWVIATYMVAQILIVFGFLHV